MNGRDIVFETDRLYAGEWSPDLAESAFRMYGDVEVVRYISVTPEPAPEPSVESTARRIEQIIERDSGFPEGHGSFPLFLKSTDEHIGTALLKVLPDENDEPSGDVEIGWHLARAHWGNGYAAEAGRGLLKLGFVR